MKRTALRMATSGQMKDVYSLMIQSVPELTFGEATIFLRKKGEMISRIQSCFPKSSSPSIEDSSWESFYKEVFGLTISLSSINIPQEREGFDRMIFVASGLTLNGVYNACAKHFPCWRYTDDLDKSVTKNDRNTTNSYAVLIRDRIEADEELAGLSADDLTIKKVSGVTLLERMLLELRYFLETGKHLDIDNITLCSGSGDSDGDVPDARWRDGKFWVYWNHPGYGSQNLRAREVVSLQS